MMQEDGRVQWLRIFVIVVGAILYFAISKSVNGINLDTVRTIMMIAGAAVLVLSVVMPAMVRSHMGRSVFLHNKAPVRESRTTVVHEEVR